MKTNFLKPVPIVAFVIIVATLVLLFCLLNPPVWAKVACTTSLVSLVGIIIYYESILSSARKTLNAFSSSFGEGLKTVLTTQDTVLEALSNVVDITNRVYELEIQLANQISPNEDCSPIFDDDLEDGETKKS